MGLKCSWTYEKKLKMKMMYMKSLKVVGACKRDGDGCFYYNEP